ncbi:hypothetical protein BGZ61DRAFT_43429 [Ilyonectria robusta]|uniref:uncharacterized protein n=1 Tax=Ilyonectria robusta TaxID=1079257 RepID=UPI001E8E3A6E|nr:uncharacterized protein BGZ61DRAFT_43429 [Ilyonectria robusta]KAH8686663.1 hypothetical protein BGZ61DRAFT_43429 [Ilyonectria robusta]
MRPVPSGNRPLNIQPPGRTDSLACGPSAAPVACFITNEASLEAGRNHSPPRLRQQADPRKLQHSSRHPSPPVQQPSPAPVAGSASSLSGDDQYPLAYPSDPGTPCFLGLSGPESALSTSSSRSSLAGPSVEYQNNPALPEPAMSDNEDKDNGSSVPQLIMPSLMVPHRRPFSHVGKSLGKLKIMVAGRPGIGKTSLIRSLAQRCEHIVHMDQIEPNQTRDVAETYASSRPHPWWKTDSQLLLTDTQRPSSLTGEMLDRNVCFVEGPGHMNGPSGPWHDLRYVKSHVTALLGKPMDDSDLFSLLNAGGEPIVDVLLYLIPNKGLEADDVEYIKNAQAVTNVIPVLARVDELGGDEVEMVRQRVLQGLAREDLDCFSFAGPHPSAEMTHVYTVSTETRPDYDTMDASVLMNSEYIAPLVPTDLGRLVDQVFSLDGCTQLRYSAAVKCVRWRRDHGYGVMQSALQSRSMIPRSAPGRALRLGPANRPQCWERLELYNWANNLRQSLHAERLHSLLSERSDHTSSPHSQLVPLALHGDKQLCLEVRRGRRRRHQDPLGILELGGQLKRKGILVLEVVGSIGLVGYLVSQLVNPDWAEETCYVALAGSRRIGMEIPGLGTLLFW